MKQWPKTTFEEGIESVCTKLEVTPAAVFLAFLDQLSGAHTAAAMNSNSPKRSADGVASPSALNEIAGIVANCRSFSGEESELSIPSSILEGLTMQARTSLALARLNESTMKAQFDAADPTDTATHTKAKSAFEWQGYRRRLEEAVATIFQSTQNTWGQVGLKMATEPWDPPKSDDSK